MYNFPGAIFYSLDPTPIQLNIVLKPIPLRKYDSVF